MSKETFVAVGSLAILVPLGIGLKWLGNQVPLPMFIALGICAIAAMIGVAWLIDPKRRSR